MAKPHSPTKAVTTIVGAGPVGLACALMLHERGIPSQLFDARTPEHAGQDARVLALSRGSWALLAPLLKENTLPRAEITDVYVSTQGGFGVTHLSAQRTSDTPPLGATVHYGALTQALTQAAQRAGINIQYQSTIEDITPTPDCVAFTVNHLQRRVVQQAPLVIVAEGARTSAQAASADHAIVSTVQMDGLNPGAAYERFTEEGPLALLPLPPTHTNPPHTRGPSMSLVWCMPQPVCTQRLALDEAAFKEALQQALGPRIGRVRAVGARKGFVLTQHIEPLVQAHRMVRIGNAAQTLHPVAGQGFNLGLRDCAVLAQRLTTPQWHDNAWMQASLTAYAAQRSADRTAIATMTRYLPTLFATRFTPLSWARSAGLVALNVLPPLRHLLAHLLMFGIRAP